MKIICKKETLLHYINIVSKAVSSKSTMSIIECILLSANETGFHMLANDLDMAIETASIESEIFHYGTVALEAKVFFDIIRKMPEGDIAISSDENNVTVIQNGKVELKILGLPGEEFPGLPEVEKQNSYKVKALELKNMIKETIFSISVDDSRPAFTGELFEVSRGLIHMVAVDGFRISYRCTPVDAPGEDISIIIPGKTMNEISKILPTENEDDVLVYFTDRHVLFELDQFTFVSRLIDGEFIRYEQSFTEDYSTRIYLDRNLFLMSLERAMLISKDTKKNPVKLIMENNVLKITSNTEIGNSYDEIDIEMDGEFMEIAFNPRYLVDVLKAVEDEKLIFQFTTSLSPCIIKGIENTNYRYLVLPLRLKS